MRRATCRISSSPMPRVVSAGVPRRMPEATKGLLVSNGIVFLLTVMPGGFERLLGHLARHALAVHEHVDEDEVVVRPARDEAEALLLQLGGERLRVGEDLPLVVLEVFAQSLAEGDGLGGDDVDERAALHAGEDLAVNVRPRARPCTG